MENGRSFNSIPSYVRKSPGLVPHTTHSAAEMEGTGKNSKDKTSKKFQAACSAADSELGDYTQWVR